MRNLPRNSFLILMAVALTLISCNRQMVYSHYESISTEGWERSDGKSYVVAIREDGTYAEEVGIRSTRIYPFMNLALIVAQEAIPSGWHRMDTLYVDLTDAEGHAEGEGISYRQVSVPAATIRLQAGDSLRVSIRHYMYKELLPGITDVGFSMTRIDG